MPPLGAGEVCPVVRWEIGGGGRGMPERLTDETDTGFERYISFSCFYSSYVHKSI